MPTSSFLQDKHAVVFGCGGSIPQFLYKSAVHLRQSFEAWLGLSVNGERSLDGTRIAATSRRAADGPGFLRCHCGGDHPSAVVVQEVR
jgi:hypothetical protein